MAQLSRKFQRYRKAHSKTVQCSVHTRSFRNATLLHLPSWKAYGSYPRSRILLRLYELRVQVWHAPLILSRKNYANDFCHTGLGHLRKCSTAGCVHCGERTSLMGKFRFQHLRVLSVFLKDKIAITFRPMGDRIRISTILHKVWNLLGIGFSNCLTRVQMELEPKFPLPKVLVRMLGRHPTRRWNCVHMLRRTTLDWVQPMLLVWLLYQRTRPTHLIRSWSDHPYTQFYLYICASQWVVPSVLLRTACAMKRCGSSGFPRLWRIRHPKYDFLEDLGPHQARPLDPLDPAATLSEISFWSRMHWKFLKRLGQTWKIVLDTKLQAKLRQTLVCSMLTALRSHPVWVHAGGFLGTDVDRNTGELWDHWWLCTKVSWDRTDYDPSGLVNNHRNAHTSNWIFSWKQSILLFPKAHYFLAIRLQSVHDSWLQLPRTWWLSLTFWWSSFWICSTSFHTVPHELQHSNVEAAKRKCMSAKHMHRHLALVQVDLLLVQRHWISQGLTKNVST